MRMKTALIGLAASAAATLLLGACKDEQVSPVTKTKIETNWPLVDSWPEETPDSTNPTPNPNLKTTVIILDDSGSMDNIFLKAKASVAEMIKGMGPDNQVAVIGLNSGVIMPITKIQDAKASIDASLNPVTSNGGTPLGASLKLARAMVEKEAGYQRGFGSYRIIATTDGEASDERTLKAAVVEILGDTPIQVSTIGLGIGSGHPLNLPGETTYAAIGNVDQLKNALKSVAAENTTFSPLTSFEEVN